MGGSSKCSQTPSAGLDVGCGAAAWDLAWAAEPLQDATRTAVTQQDLKQAVERPWDSKPAVVPPQDQTWSAETQDLPQDWTRALETQQDQAWALKSERPNTCPLGPVWPNGHHQNKSPCQTHICQLGSATKTCCISFPCDTPISVLLGTKIATVWSVGAQHGGTWGGAEKNGTRESANACEILQWN